jgi:D-alanine-D-alanine ligase
MGEPRTRRSVRMMRLGIVCGGRSGEHEVSLRSACGIYGAVDRRRFDPVLLAIDKQGRWRAGSLEALVLDGHDPARIRLAPGALEVVPVGREDRLVLLAEHGLAEQAALDVAFPIVHGTDGEDGALQGWLRLMGVPFVGTDVLGSAIGMDKDIMKRLLARAGAPIPRFRTLRRGGDFQSAWEAAERELGLPLFVKPASLGSSVGISRVNDRRGFETAVEEAFRYDIKVMIEEAVPGRELECSVLGNRDGAERPQASRVGEIRPRHAFYSYAAKYLDDHGADLLVPAPIDIATEARVQELALRVFHLLEADGLARVDFFLVEDGRLIVNEINTLPGFTPISMYPKLWEATGLAYTDLVTRLVDLALEKHRQRKALKRNFDLGKTP